MPAYDFECPKCGNIEEYLDRGEFEEPWCDECRVEMRKLISAHAFTPGQWLKD